MRTILKLLASGALGGASYNAYVTAWVARLQLLGYTVPNAQRLAAISTMLDTLGASFLSSVDRFFLFAMNDTNLQNASSVSLINPSSTAGVYSGAGTYATNGYNGDGATSYFDTNFNPATQGAAYTLNAASRIFSVEVAPTVGTSIEGTLTTSQRNHSMYNAASSVQRINSGSNNLSAAVDFTGTGYHAINRVDGTNVSIYVGTTKSDRTQTAVAVVSENQTLGKAGPAFSNTRFGFHLMGGNFTQTQHSTFNTAYAAYKTAIGL